MSIHTTHTTLSTWGPTLAACGLAGVGYMIGWSRGSRWTHDAMSHPSRLAPQGAPHWS